MRKQIALILIMATLILMAIEGVAGASQAPTAPKKNTSTPAHSTTTTPRDNGSLLKPDSLKLQAPAVFDAKFTTTKGDFVVEVTRAWAPRGADRFYNLVKYHFFDNASFFRVLEGFIVQFGVNAKPEISAVWENATIPDDPVTQSNTRGTLTFATAGANTRTTQLFINLGDNSRLDGMGFSAFGKITTGMDVVDKLYNQYGEGAPDGHGPDQGRIQKEGKAYIDKEFPLLDSIKTAVIVPVAPPAAPKPAATTAK